MENELSYRANRYLRQNDHQAKLAKKLGAGQEGTVWESSSGSALKVFERENNFNRELQCYEILKQNNISKIEGFNVPLLIGSDSQLRVIEMTIVMAPYILDFGKAHFRAPDFSEEVMAEYEADASESFGENWPIVENALFKLELMGIWYIDAKLQNINCNGLLYSS